MSSSDHAAQLIRNAGKLRTKNGYLYRSVYITPDRNVEKRKAFKKLVEEVNLKQTAELDKAHFIRNNKIVSLARNSEPG